MKNDDSDLIERLRAIDRPVTFDARRVAKGVITERIRRRRRKSFVGAMMFAAAVTSAIVWQGPQDNAPSVISHNENRSVGTANDRGTGQVPRSIADTGVVLPSTSAADRQVQDLLGRIESTNAEIAERRLENERQLFAVYRAHAAANLSLSGLLDED